MAESDESKAYLRGRCDPEAPLQPHLGHLLDKSVAASYKILDVGAGPLTSIGKKWRDTPLELVAIDPMARYYDDLLETFHLVPPVRTRLGDAEKVGGDFPQEHFDLVCSDNSLDHCYDPIRAMQGMLKILKPGGHVCLQHYTNEGVEEGYDGFHQWNFYEEAGDFWISNEKGSRTNVTQLFSTQASVVCEPFRLAGKDWLRVIFQKHADKPIW
jgi:SAM-dependent methyltransferase